MLRLTDDESSSQIMRQSPRLWLIHSLWHTRPRRFHVNYGSGMRFHFHERPLDILFPKRLALLVVIFLSLVVSILYPVNVFALSAPKVRPSAAQINPLARAIQLPSDPQGDMDLDGDGDAILQSSTSPHSESSVSFVFLSPVPDAVFNVEARKDSPSNPPPR